MRIEGTSPLRSGAEPRRPERRVGGGFRVDEPAAGRAPATAAPSTSVSDVTALLALQELPDPASGRSRGLRRGHDMLDLLDQVRVALLFGRIEPARLRRLLALVRERAAAPVEPALREVLDEIELRAAVELAKFQQIG